MRRAEWLLGSLPYYPADLPVSGRDLLAAGLAPGPTVGKILLDLVRRVQQGSLSGDRVALLVAAQKAAARRVG